MIRYLRDNPKRLLLIDGIGALGSAFFLGVVLVQLEKYVGMPINVLYWLSGSAGLFAFYSLGTYGLAQSKHRQLLAIIAIANLCYSCVTVGLVIYYFSRLTLLGIGYFVMELAILAGLIVLEASSALAEPKGQSKASQS